MFGRVITLIICLICSAMLVASDHRNVDEKISQCLRVTRPLYFRPDLQSHYDDLLTFTAKYRNFTYEKSYSKMEVTFITNFMKKPFHYFHGMFPLFVKWCDYSKMKGYDIHVFDELKHKLRDDVVYVAFSQGNDGLATYFYDKPNVLVLSSGGRGHVALPLVKHEYELLPWNENMTRFNITFLGSRNNGHCRKLLLATLEEELIKYKKSHSKESLTYLFDKTNDWVNVVRDTIFNVAPEGRGRGTFRLSEIIQLGRIPIILHSSEAWIPYEGSRYAADKLGIEVRSSDISTFLKRMPLISMETILDRIHLIQEASARYHLNGVMQQIGLFFQQPFIGHGLLHCTGEAKRMRQRFLSETTFLPSYLY